VADDWIQMRGNLATDPAVIAMAASLGLDEYGIIGRLHRFWFWANQHTKTGRIPGVTGAWIDRFLSTEKFSENLERVGWLRVTDDGIAIPKWSRHNSKSAKKRALAAQRKARQRERDRSRKGRDRSGTTGEERREDVPVPPLGEENGTTSDGSDDAVLSFPIRFGKVFQEIARPTDLPYRGSPAEREAAMRDVEALEREVGEDEALRLLRKVVKDREGTTDRARSIPQALLFIKQEREKADGGSRGTGPGTDWAGGIAPFEGDAAEV